MSCTCVIIAVPRHREWNTFPPIIIYILHFEWTLYDYEAENIPRPWQQCQDIQYIIEICIKCWLFFSALPSISFAGSFSFNQNVLSTLRPDSTNLVIYHETFKSVLYMIRSHREWRWCMQFKLFSCLPHRFLPAIHHFQDEIYDSLDPILPNQTAATGRKREKEMSWVRVVSSAMNSISAINGHWRMDVSTISDVDMLLIDQFLSASLYCIRCQYSCYVQREPVHTAINLYECRETAINFQFTSRSYKVNFHRTSDACFAKIFCTA